MLIIIPFRATQGFVLELISSRVACISAIFYRRPQQDSFLLHRFTQHPDPAPAAEISAYPQNKRREEEKGYDVLNKATGTPWLQCSWETDYGEGWAAAEFSVPCSEDGVGGRGNGRSFAPPFARNRNLFKVLVCFALPKFLLEQGEGEAWYVKQSLARQLAQDSCPTLSKLANQWFVVCFFSYSSLWCL